MRRVIPLLALVTRPLALLTSISSAPAQLYSAAPPALNSKMFIGQVNVQLNDPVYLDGVMSTDKGGIATAHELFVQAQNISYTRKSSAGEHTLTASDKLYLIFQGKSYRGAKVEIDFSTGIIRIWDGCTKNGDWFIGGEEIEIAPSKEIRVKNAFLSTSENLKNDWSINATALTILPYDSIEAKNVTFCFEKTPLFWLPSYSRSLKTGQGEAAPFKYTVRWGGSQGFRIGMTYQLGTIGNWNNKAIFDYNFRYGLGVGLFSKYRGDSEFENFEMLNYVAQGSKKSFSPSHLRYRLQGIYQNYYEESNLNFVAMYDKLSDKGMKSEFSDHPLTNARPALTQATLWREEANWIGRMNGRVRINNFQTVKQELPLFTFNLRPHVVGNTRWMLDNKLSTGYLDYVYARKTPHVKNFSSTRSELSQKLFTTYQLAPFSVSPFIGYRAIHYSSSPQHQQRFQALGELGATAKTRLIRFTSSGFEALEPYLSVQSILHPTVKPGKNYIFDLEDGWNSVHETRCGFQHTFIRSPNARGFQQKLFTDIFTRAFIKTKNLSSHPTKIWLHTVYDATESVSYKLKSAYDFQRGVVDHFNIQMRKTLSKSAAIALEYRQRSRFAWRKIDPDNFIIDATKSAKSLKHSEMSDERKTALATLYWTPAPNLNIEFSSIHGWREHSRKKYHDVDITVATIVKGALHVRFSYGIKSGGSQKFYISFGLGPKKGSSSTGFRKIGEGNYDMW